MLGKPQLCQDFACCQVAAKTLMARGAKTAPYSTTGLRGHAQSAAIIFGNKYGFYRIAITHIEQPLDRAVFRFMLGNDRQAFNTGIALELFTQGLGQIGHLVKIAGSALVNPAVQLRSSKTFFPQ